MDETPPSNVPPPHVTDQRPAPVIDERPGGFRNVGFLIGVLVVASAIVGLAMSSFDEQVYYYTVAEARANQPEIGTTEFRIKGNVVPGSLRLREGVLNDHMFTLRADGEDMLVHYTGPLPDTFSDDAEVIALGRFGSPERFEAIEVVAKCPSRYEEQAPTARQEG